MARFVDLEEDGADSALIADPHVLTPLQATHLLQRNGDAAAADTEAEAEAPPAPRTTARSPVTEAFQCYPIVIAIVASIDLNTLDALARTSRRIHDALIQYRTGLIAATLRCANTGVAFDPSETFRFRARAGNWFYMEDGRNYNGKAGHCATDLVSECRRCATVICRNCTIKPPAPVLHRERHRRLCTACSRAPIASLLRPPQDPGLDMYSEAVARELCKCDVDGVWLCQPCGRSIRGLDHEYHRIWRWRVQYGEVLGGLGTGIGDGDRGVPCGRELRCCGAKEREQEIDCDAEDAKDSSTTPWLSERASSSDEGVPGPHRERASTPQLGPGYARHEIEGIGGIVKRKLVRMVRVGACVPEYEDERLGRNKSLTREACGDARSWCGWCWRIVPGARDRLGDCAPPSPEERRVQLA